MDLGQSAVLVIQILIPDIIVQICPLLIIGNCFNDFVASIIFAQNISGITSKIRLHKHGVVCGHDNLAIYKWSNFIADLFEQIVMYS